MGGNSKSLLPLVEILISVGIFAIAVMLTLELFLLASFLGTKTSDTAKAIFEVQNVAENIKTIKTDAEMEKYINDELNGGIVYYDVDWNIVDNQDKAVYNLTIKMDVDAYSSGGLYKFNIELSKITKYPFIDENKDENYIPVLVNVDASKFILK